MTKLTALSRGLPLRLGAAAARPSRCCVPVAVRAASGSGSGSGAAPAPARFVSYGAFVNYAQANRLVLSRAERQSALSAAYAARDAASASAPAATAGWTGRDATLTPSAATVRELLANGGEADMTSLASHFRSFGSLVNFTASHGIALSRAQRQSLLLMLHRAAPPPAPAAQAQHTASSAGHAPSSIAQLLAEETQFASYGAFVNHAATHGMTLNRAQRQAMLRHDYAVRPASARLLATSTHTPAPARHGAAETPTRMLHGDTLVALLQRGLYASVASHFASYGRFVNYAAVHKNLSLTREQRRGMMHILYSAASPSLDVKQAQPSQPAPTYAAHVYELSNLFADKGNFAVAYGIPLTKSHRTAAKRPEMRHAHC